MSEPARCQVTMHGYRLGDLLSVGGKRMRVIRVESPRVFYFREARWYDRIALLIARFHAHNRKG